jgi:hypothetical protein
LTGPWPARRLENDNNETQRARTLLEKARVQASRARLPLPPLLMLPLPPPPLLLRLLACS